MVVRTRSCGFTVSEDKAGIDSAASQRHQKPLTLRLPLPPGASRMLRAAHTGANAIVQYHERVYRLDPRRL